MSLVWTDSFSGGFYSVLTGISLSFSEFSGFSGASGAASMLILSSDAF